MASHSTPTQNILLFEEKRAGRFGSNEPKDRKQPTYKKLRAVRFGKIKQAYRAKFHIGNIFQLFSSSMTAKPLAFACQESHSNVHILWLLCLLFFFKMSLLIEPNDYLNAHQRAREGGFRVVSLLAGAPGRGRAVFHEWLGKTEAAPDVVTVPEPDLETARRALDYAPAGSALEIVPSEEQFKDAMETALSLVNERRVRPVAVISGVTPIELAVTAQSVDIVLQLAVFGGLVPLAAGITEQVERFTPKPKIPDGYRSIHEYILHTLILHDRSINARFLANHRIAGRSRKHYEIDLWCETLRLAIEVDGIQHFTTKQKQRDQARDTDLAAAGIKTQRILASAVMSDPSKVLKLVRQTINSRTMEIHQ